jgi:predicted RNase H-like HicB family nuclease
MMRKAYPVILSKDDDFIVVDVPDFQVGTQGTDYADAMFMARDVIGLCGIDMEDDGKELPEVSGMEAVKALSKPGDVVTLVDVDFDEYRRQNDLRMVKKNCTVPAWLSYEAEKQGVNFSALLQSALKKELKVKSPADIVR